jgi:hypothetical protein
MQRIQGEDTVPSNDIYRRSLLVADNLILLPLFTTMIFDFEQKTDKHSQASYGNSD